MARSARKPAHSPTPTVLTTLFVLAAVGWVLRGYSEQYSGLQAVIVWASHTEKMTVWKPGYYGREMSAGKFPR